MTLVSTTKVSYISDRAALAGIATPLRDVTVRTDVTGPVLAVVGTQLGTLSVDTAPGASVRGNGSSLLRLGGTVAQVNAALQTLTYHGDTTGTDSLTITLIDDQGALTRPFLAPVVVLPVSGPVDPAGGVVAIDQGTLTLDTRTVDGPVIVLSVPAGSTNATTGIFVNSTIGPRSTLVVRNDNGSGDVAPRLAIAGQVEFEGQSTFVGNGTAILLAEGATLHNEGSMAIAPHAARFSGGGRLINDGSITLGGDNDAGAPVRIETEIGGVGQISLTAGASLSLRAGVSATETIMLGAGANTLRLAQPSTFAGIIAGFSRGDTLVLEGSTVTGAIYTGSADAATGVLTLLNGQTAVGSLRFSAPETGSTFQFDTDTLGNATIRLATPVVDTPASVDVYRFFDAKHGTQLLTQDGTERDAILASRPDLRFEGVGLRAIAPAQAGAESAPVYRFFDTSNGTHFMTANVIERDTLLGTRPDLVFEPSSTLFEHATAQPGDMAVYRFFDKSSGAHFYTTNAGERASISATRPDMTMEGIAFYAPGA